MAKEMKCHYCGCSSFSFEDRFANDLVVKSYDDDGTEMSFFGSNPLDGFTLVVCKECGHASLFRNDSSFVKEGKLSLIKDEAKPLVKEIGECEKEIRLTREKMEKMDKDSQAYGDAQKRITKLGNQIKNIKAHLSNILADIHLAMGVEEALQRLS